MRSYLPSWGETASPAFPDAPTLHTCPMYFSQLVDPALRFSHLGPGFCTRDNLFGVGYLVILVLNYVFAIIAFLAVFGVLRRFGRWRAVTRVAKHTELKLEENDVGSEERAMMRAEQGESSWSMGKVCTDSPCYSVISRCCERKH
jgi:hypothetical protein